MAGAGFTQGWWERSAGPKTTGLAGAWLSSPAPHLLSSSWLPSPPLRECPGDRTLSLFSASSSLLLTPGKFRAAPASTLKAGFAYVTPTCEGVILIFQDDTQIHRGQRLATWTWSQDSTSEPSKFYFLKWQSLGFCWAALISSGVLAYYKIACRWSHKTPWKSR
jgi:hypothetical protein